MNDGTNLTANSVATPSQLVGDIRVFRAGVIAGVLALIGFLGVVKILVRS